MSEPTARDKAKVKFFDTVVTVLAGREPFGGILGAAGASAHEKGQIVRRAVDEYERALMAEADAMAAQMAMLKSSSESLLAKYLDEKLIAQKSVQDLLFIQQNMDAASRAGGPK